MIVAINSPSSFHTGSEKQEGLGSNELSRDTESKFMAGKNNIDFKSCLWIFLFN